MRVLRAALLLSAAAYAADLDQIKAEKNLEKRFEQALNAADSAMQKARATVSESGTVSELNQALGEVTQAMDISLSALRETGKTPRKLGKQYKKGELRSRAILRQLENLVINIGLENRPPAEAARDRISAIHEEYLLGVMSKK